MSAKKLISLGKRLAIEGLPTKRTVRRTDELHQVAPETLGHMLFRGPTGSCKTSYLLFLLQQYLEAETAAFLLVLDFGGTKPMGHILRAQAQASGRPFYYLSLSPDEDSVYFPVHRNIFSYSDSAFAAAEATLTLLQLDYGPGYGRGHFTAQNLWGIKAAYEKERPDQGIPTLAEVADFLRTNSKHKEASHAALLIETLSKHWQLQDPPNASAKVLDIATARKEHAIVYANLATMRSKFSARLAGNLLLALNAVGAAEESLHGEPISARISIDEAPVIATDSLGTYLTQSRKYNQFVDFLYQNDSQLEPVDCPGLLDVIKDNTDCKAIFSANGAIDETVEFIQSFCKEEIVELNAGELKGKGLATSPRVDLLPTLGRNEILDVLGFRQAFWFIDTRQSDEPKWREPIALRFEHPTSQAVHKELEHKPFPKRNRPEVGGKQKKADPKQKARQLLLQVERVLKEKKQRELPGLLDAACI